MAIIGPANSGSYTPADVERRRKMAAMLMGNDFQAREPFGALAQALQGARAGWELHQADEDQSKATADADAAYDSTMSAYNTGGNREALVQQLMGAAGNEWLTPNKQAMVNLLLGRALEQGDLEAQSAREAAAAARPEYGFTFAPDGTLIRTDKTSGGFENMGQFGAPETEDPTALMQNLEAAGLQPGTPEYSDAVLKSLGGTTVNVGAGEGQYDKTLNESLAKAYIGYQDAGRTGQSTLNTLDAMEAQMADPGFYSGAFGDTAALLKKVGAGIGLDPEGAASLEGFNSLAKQQALNVMGGSLGSGFSNADRDFVMDQVANLGNTPAGNRKIIGMQRKLAQRQIEIAQLASVYADSNGGRLDAGFDAFLAGWAEQNPLFEADAPKRPVNEADYRALPSGSQYMAPDGTMRTKP